jgi:hypothetical protein
MTHAQWFQEQAEGDTSHIAKRMTRTGLLNIGSEYVFTNTPLPSGLNGGTLDLSATRQRWRELAEAERPQRHQNIEQAARVLSRMMVGEGTTAAANTLLVHRQRNEKDAEAASERWQRHLVQTRAINSLRNAAQAQAAADLHRGAYYSPHELQPGEPRQVLVRNKLEDHGRDVGVGFSSADQSEFIRRSGGINIHMTPDLSADLAAQVFNGAGVSGPSRSRLTPQAGQLSESVEVGTRVVVNAPNTLYHGRRGVLSRHDAVGLPVIELDEPVDLGDTVITEVVQADANLRREDGARLLCEEDGPTSAEVGSAIAWHSYRKVRAQNEARRADEEADEHLTPEQLADLFASFEHKTDEQIADDLSLLLPDELKVIENALDAHGLLSTEAAGEVPDHKAWQGGVDGVGRAKKKKFGTSPKGKPGNISTSPTVREVSEAITRNVR